MREREEVKFIDWNDKPPTPPFSSESAEEQTAAQANGDTVETLNLNTGHFELIAPGQKERNAVEHFVLVRAFKIKALANKLR